MYDKMRREYLTALHGKIPEEYIGEALSALDGIAAAYSIGTAETALAVPDYREPAVLDVYLACKSVAGLSSTSIEGYRYILRDFFRAICKPLAEITANDIRLYLYQTKRQRDISDRSLDGYRSKICTFFTWLNDEGYIQTNPGRNIEPIKYEKKQREYLTAIELEKLRRACTTKRDLALVEFLYSTGCRVSEAAGVKLAQIDWKSNSVDVLGKGKKHRTVYINAKAELAIKDYIGSLDYSPVYLFTTDKLPHGRLGARAIEMDIKKIGGASGIEKPVTPHILRHTTATVAAQQGMPIQDVSKLLGHASINTTMIYAQTSQEQIRAEHLRFVV